MPENHRARAEWLADKAHHFTYGDGADTATGQALATEALARAVLALTPTQPTAEMAALRARITGIHREVDGSPDSEGSCVEDGQDYPCATLRALDAEGGA